jgi:hypothetical protein
MRVIIPSASKFFGGDAWFYRIDFSINAWSQLTSQSEAIINKQAPRL